MIKISNAEWKVMNLLWDKEPQTITQITKALQEDTGWSKHVVITYLKRLEEKKIIHHEEGGRAKLYFVDIKKENAVIEETNNLLNRVFKGNAGLMISMMIEQNTLSEDEIEELHRILNKKKK